MVSAEAGEREQNGDGERRQQQDPGQHSDPEKLRCGEDSESRRQENEHVIQVRMIAQ